MTIVTEGPRTTRCTFADSGFLSIIVQATLGTVAGWEAGKKGKRRIKKHTGQAVDSERVVGAEGAAPTHIWGVCVSALGKIMISRFQVRVSGVGFDRVDRVCR